MKTLVALAAVLAALSLAAAPVGAESEKGEGGDKVYRAEESTLPLGKHRVTDDKGRSSIIYSTGGPTRTKKEKREQAEKDRERAWNMLESLIIDTRRQTTGSD